MHFLEIITSLSYLHPDDKIKDFRVGRPDEICSRQPSVRCLRSDIHRGKTSRILNKAGKGKKSTAYKVLILQITHGNPPYLQWLQNAVRSGDDPS